MSRKDPPRRESRLTLNRRNAVHDVINEGVTALNNRLVDQVQEKDHLLEKLGNCLGNYC